MAEKKLSFLNEELCTLCRELVLGGILLNQHIFSQVACILPVLSISPKCTLGVRYCRKLLLSSLPLHPIFVDLTLVLEHSFYSLLLSLVYAMAARCSALMRPIYWHLTVNVQGVHFLTLGPSIKM